MMLYSFGEAFAAMECVLETPVCGLRYRTRKIIYIKEFRFLSIFIDNKYPSGQTIKSFSDVSAEGIFIFEVVNPYLGHDIYPKPSSGQEIPKITG